MVLWGPGHTHSKKVAYSKLFFSNAIWDYVCVSLTYIVRSNTLGAATMEIPSMHVLHEYWINLGQMHNIRDGL